MLHANANEDCLLHLLHKSDKHSGVCTAVIKEEGQEFGRWRAHVCRAERPYMCKRGLNSKFTTVAIRLDSSVRTVCVICMKQMNLD